jgi:hypothetical protein
VVLGFLYPCAQDQTAHFLFLSPKADPSLETLLSFPTPTSSSGARKGLVPHCLLGSSSGTWADFELGSWAGMKT